MGMSSGGSSSASSGAAPSTASPPNALQQIMTMLGQQNQSGAGQQPTMPSSAAPGAMSINPFYRRPNSPQANMAPAADGTPAPGAVAPSAPTMPGVPSAGGSTMSGLSNAIFGTNKASAMKSLGSLGAVAGK